MNAATSGTTRPSLASQAGVDSDERADHVAATLEEVGARGLHSIRVVFADQHGILRGKTIRGDLLSDAFDQGIGITSALLLKDTGQVNVYPVWAAGAGLDKPWLTGAGDMIMLPDPSTFRTLPWVDGTGWVLCDLYSPSADPIPLSMRGHCAAAERNIAELGYEVRAGLEIEFHLYKVGPSSATVHDVSGPVDRLALQHTHLGRMYLAEARFDSIEPFLEPLRRGLTALGVVPRTLEIELGASQVELTFSPTGALEAADDAVLLRGAIKQIAHRHGMHATFMARPGIVNAFSSGWHLHQSLVDAKTGLNAFAPDSENPVLSPIGRHYLAGLLAHAAESCLLTTPTVTGYKRYRAESLAPDRIAWGQQHRGAMLRVIGGVGDPATRVENRVGDSAANPYLYVASQMLSGAAGLAAAGEPPPRTDSPYHQAAGPLLPRTLGEAIDAFESSPLYRSAFGDEVVDYLVGLKRGEWERFLGTVTDWEQREYFDLF